jgi:hypothetical protein
VKAVPYLNRVIGSLRDEWLELQQHLLRAKRLAEKRPDRATLIAIEDAHRDSDRASENFRGALRELRKIDVFLLDPIQGLAFIPFQREEELAWMIFDNFDENGLIGWRWHKDPLEMRRPLTEINELPPTPLAPSLEASGN